MIKEIKSIPLAAFLSQLGHEPAARKGTSGISRRCDRNRHHRSRSILHSTAGMISVLAEAATSSTWQQSCISQPTCAISCVASPTAILCHRRRQSLPLFPSDTLHQAWNGLMSCHWNTAHLSHTSKSVVFRHTSLKRIARRLITASTASRILPWHLRMSAEVGNCATATSKVAGDARTSHIYRGREMARQQSVPCLRDSLIFSLHSHSESSAEPTQSYSTRLSMSTRLCLISKVTLSSIATLTTTMPEKQHSPS